MTVPNSDKEIKIAQKDQTLFAEIILPVPIPSTFTYRIPRDLINSVAIGTRVIVQFGKKKILTGIVYTIHSKAPKAFEAKYLLETLDEFPLINHYQLELFEWISSYYMSTLGEVFNIGIPSGLKLSSESKIIFHPDFDLNNSDEQLSDQEFIILNALKNQPKGLTYTEVSKIIGAKHIHQVIKSLIYKDTILILEEIQSGYKPKVDKRVRLTNPLLEEKKLERIFSEVINTPQQEELILAYLQQIPILSNPEKNKKGLPKKYFNDLSSSALKSLLAKGIFEEFETEVSRIKFPDIEIENISLTETQMDVEKAILSGFEKNKVVLLHGITGSGKTEIYIDLIQKAVDDGYQALFLLPEIALTTQIVSRLKKYFGSQMGVYHSRFSDNERVEVWKGLSDGSIKIIVGVRSSIFLPFDNLGIIVVDEEHESSYKQFEPAPRYHARDCAIVLGRIHHAKVILGSATPSLESYYNAKVDKYELVSLDERYGDAILPEFVIVDMKEARRKRKIQEDFSYELIEAIQKTLSNKEQAIIFKNRRGYSPILQCDICAWVPKCPNCSVSLTYHQYKKSLNCHYCGFNSPLPESCGACSSKKIKTVGSGTEKLEETLQLLLPDSSIARMDLETTRSKTSYEKIISNFESGKINLLVGTQMVSKGLDFDHVNLVGVIDFDQMLHFPDFRSYERTYQLVTQVSGRAGRRKKQGIVYIQTSNPEFQIIESITNNDFISFYNHELFQRKQYFYPPFARLIKITVKDRNKDKSQHCALELAKKIRNRKISGVTILGPEKPSIDKIRNYYLNDILIKISRQQNQLQKIKFHLKDITEHLSTLKEFKSCYILFDVDVQ